MGKIFEMKDFEKRRVEKKTPTEPGTIYYLRPKESELLYPVIFLSPTEYDLILDNHLFPAVGFLSEEEVFSLGDIAPDFYKMAKDKRIISAWMLLKLDTLGGSRDS